jgi:hypothetical protein
MRAAGFRPATPALAQMLEISTDHACDAVGQHTPVGLPSPQSLLLSSTIDAAGRCSQDLPGRHQASNRHRARCGRVLSLPRLRALQVCRRRPTLGVAPIPHGRHPQTFTVGDQEYLSGPLHSRHFDVVRIGEHGCFVAPARQRLAMWAAMPQVRGCGRARFFEGEAFFGAVTFSHGTVTAKTFSVAALPLSFIAPRGSVGCDCGMSSWVA